MTDDLVDVSVERRGDVAIVALRGEVDASNAAHVHGQVLDSVDARATVLDLSEVRYLDSAGIAVLEGLRRATDLRLIVGDGSVISRAVSIVGFDQLVPVYASRAEALDALGAGGP